MRHFCLLIIALISLSGCGGNDNVEDSVKEKGIDPLSIHIAAEGTAKEPVSLEPDWQIWKN